MSYKTFTNPTALFATTDFEGFRIGDLKTKWYRLLRNYQQGKYIWKSTNEELKNFPFARFEEILFTQGMVGLALDAKGGLMFGLVVPKSITFTFNGEFDKFSIVSFYNGKQIPIDYYHNKTGYIIRNDYDHSPTFFPNDFYLNQIQEIGEALRSNIKISKPRIIINARTGIDNGTIPDAKLKQLDTLFAREGSFTYIPADMEVIENEFTNQAEILHFDLKEMVNYIKQQIGIGNGNIDFKKERIQNAEIETHKEESFILVEQRADVRKIAVEEINKLWPHLKLSFEIRELDLDEEEELGDKHEEDKKSNTENN